MDPRLHIKRTLSSGNGVFAKAPIPANTLLLTTPAPYLSVINHIYRKEACGYCFDYNLGRRWKTRSKSETGFVFCGETCLLDWEAEVGVLGIQAYVAGEVLVRRLQQEKLQFEDAEESEKIPPTAEDVLRVWSDAVPAAAQILALRTQVELLGATGDVLKTKKKYLKAVSISGSPDMLSFFVSGILALDKSRAGPESPELSLSLDMLYEAEVPYISHHALLAHTTSYLQLLSVLPLPLLDLITPSNLRRITGLAYDNAFGIRSIDHITSTEREDPGSELLGYALYPVASIFNHSCVPNVRKARNGRVWKFWSAREIGVGEEVCITYLGGDERSLGTEERRERLRDGWEFECGCVGCC